MAAYIRGWKDYIEGDPSPAHTLMKQVNPNVTDEFLAISHKMIVDEKLVIGRHATDDSQTGRISRNVSHSKSASSRSSASSPRGS